MSTNLKQRLIRLGDERPELRDHLRPIITAMRGREKELYEQWTQARDDYKDGNLSKSMFQRTMMDLQAQAEEIGADISEWEDKYHNEITGRSQSSGSGRQASSESYSNVTVVANLRKIRRAAGELGAIESPDDVRLGENYLQVNPATGMVKFYVMVDNVGGVDRTTLTDAIEKASDSSFTISVESVSSDTLAFEFSKS